MTCLLNGDRSASFCYFGGFSFFLDWCHAESAVLDRFGKARPLQNRQGSSPRKELGHVNVHGLWLSDYPARKP